MTAYRYKTRVLVRLDSHIKSGIVDDSDGIDLSPDVIRFTSNKQVKARGRFQFDLVPRVNYLNVIYPNDVVNVYIDPGDGETGFTRVMFGYVDRVNRTETTNQDTGAVDTKFTVICSDFQKAVDQTNIYFNPHLPQFIDARFRNSLLGQGSTLRTNGLVAFGTPADFVENILLTLAGFGQQWELPESYPSINTSMSREVRVNRAKRRLPHQLVNDLKGTALIEGGEDINEFLQDLPAWINAASKVASKRPLDKVDDGQSLKLLIAENKVKGISQRIINSEIAFRVYQQALDLKDSDAPRGIVDLMELGFIEHLAIDGFSANLSVWQNQGALGQLLYGRSNAIVNELMFDLRPVSERDEKGRRRIIGKGGYSKEADELKINTEGYKSMKHDVPGVRYVPAVVMREYPFSTVEGFDLGNFYLYSDDVKGVGFQPFGPIFAQKAENGTLSLVERVTYDYATIINEKNAAPLSPEACLFSDDPSTGAIKHLDVCKIRNSDVISMNVGRDDNDVINLFALYSSSSNTENWKYLLKQFSPIVNPISIARNGLRVQEPKTEYGNYSRDPECEAAGSAVDNAQIRRNLIRWQLLMDHWYQHNIEYLSGTVSLRGMPWIRAGYRADFLDRNESYYVESVAHQWEYPNALRTTIQVSRGQRNDPLLAYIPPAAPQRYTKEVEIPKEINVGFPAQLAKIAGIDLNRGTETQKFILSRYEDGDGFEPASDGGDRTRTGRLGEYFKVKDTHGTLYSVGGVLSDDAKANSTDIQVNGRAEYPGAAPSEHAPGRFGNVPSEASVGDILLEQERINIRLQNEQDVKNAAAAKKHRAGRKKRTK